METPGARPAGVACAHCGRALDLGSPDTTRLALLRDWDGDGDVVPWDEVDDNWPPEGDWMIRCVRPFCDAGHARAWMAAGHPLADEWQRRQPPPDSSDLAFVVGCVVALAVLFVLACLVILGAAEAWRIIF